MKRPEMVEVPHSPFDRGLVPYFVVAYAFTWLFHGGMAVSGLTISIEEFGPARALYMVGLFGPLVGALSVSMYYGGKQAAVELLRGALRWRFGVAWYLWALFVIPGMYFVAIVVVNRGVPHPSEWLTFPVLAIVGQLWVVIGEEYGWRGFALPRLQARFGSLGASFVLGFLWSSWHLPMFLIPGLPQYSEAILVSFLLYVATITFITIVMTMLYNQARGSVLVCMLFHASLNITVFCIHVPSGSTTILLALEVLILAASIMFLPRPLFGRAPPSNSAEES